MSKVRLTWTVDSTGEFIKANDAQTGTNGCNYFCDLARMEAPSLELLGLKAKMPPGSTGSNEMTLDAYNNWTEGAPAVARDEDDYPRLVHELGKDNIWD